jgi:hypothetical protein
MNHVRVVWMAQLLETRFGCTIHELKDIAAG